MNSDLRVHLPRAVMVRVDALRSRRRGHLRWLGIVACLGTTSAALCGGCNSVSHGPAPSDASTDAEPDARVLHDAATGVDAGDAQVPPGTATCGVADAVSLWLELDGTRIIPAMGDGKPQEREAVVAEIARGDLDSTGFTPRETGRDGRIQLEASGETFALSVHGASSFAVEVGAAVQLRWSNRDDWVYAPTRSLELRAGARLLVSYTIGGAPLPDGFASELGEVHCRGYEQCIPGAGFIWVSRLLRVHGPCEQSVALPANGRDTLCGYEVFAGENRSELDLYLRGEHGCTRHSFPAPELLIVKGATAEDADAGL